MFAVACRRATGEGMADSAASEDHSDRILRDYMRVGRGLSDGEGEHLLRELSLLIGRIYTIPFAIVEPTFLNALLRPSALPLVIAPTHDC